ncbi:hypothetical protein PR048_024351 [Dryococelus australis]|uniref:Uncharacterized protein n=1 Tax=Dryococelus australis TaxID=614101 RepID=A0ABQ9GNF3_9NEOP|nr:hypothetical protein PR048_024351 [Dryococelus australis]
MQRGFGPESYYNLIQTLINVNKNGACERAPASIQLRALSVLSLFRPLSDELRRPESVLFDVMMTLREREHERAPSGPLKSRPKLSLVWTSETDLLTNSQWDNRTKHPPHRMHRSANSRGSGKYIFYSIAAKSRIERRKDKMKEPLSVIFEVEAVSRLAGLPCDSSNTFAFPVSRPRNTVDIPQCPALATQWIFPSVPPSQHSGYSPVSRPRNTVDIPQCPSLATQWIFPSVPPSQHSGYSPVSRPRNTVDIPQCPSLATQWIFPSAPPSQHSGYSPVSRPRNTVDIPQCPSLATQWIFPSAPPSQHSGYSPVSRPRNTVDIPQCPALATLWIFPSVPPSQHSGYSPVPLPRNTVDIPQCPSLATQWIFHVRPPTLWYSPCPPSQHSGFPMSPRTQCIPQCHSLATQWIFPVSALATQVFPVSRPRNTVDIPQCPALATQWIFPSAPPSQHSGYSPVSRPRNTWIFPSVPPSQHSGYSPVPLPRNTVDIPQCPPSQHSGYSPVSRPRNTVDIPQCPSLATQWIFPSVPPRNTVDIPQCPRPLPATQWIFPSAPPSQHSGYSPVSRPRNTVDIPQCPALATQWIFPSAPPSQHSGYSPVSLPRNTVDIPQCPSLATQWIFPSVPPSQHVDIPQCPPSQHSGYSPVPLPRNTVDIPQCPPLATQWIFPSAPPSQHSGYSPVSRPRNTVDIPQCPALATQWIFPSAPPSQHSGYSLVSRPRNTVDIPQCPALATQWIFPSVPPSQHSGYSPVFLPRNTVDIPQCPSLATQWIFPSVPPSQHSGYSPVPLPRNTVDIPQCPALATLWIFPSVPPSQHSGYSPVSRPHNTVDRQNEASTYYSPLTTLPFSNPVHEPDLYNDQRHPKFVLLFGIRLNYTVLSVLEMASFHHWLLHRCEATPFLTELHVIGGHDCEELIYWRRVTQGASHEVWRIAKVYQDDLNRRLANIAVDMLFKATFLSALHKSINDFDSKFLVTCLHVEIGDISSDCLLRDFLGKFSTGIPIPGQDSCRVDVFLNGTSNSAVSKTYSFSLDRGRAAREVASEWEICDCEYQALKCAAGRLDYWTRCVSETLQMMATDRLNTSVDQEITLPATVAERLVRSPVHQGEPGSIPGRVTGVSQVGIVPDDVVGRRVFSGTSRFPRPFIPVPLHIPFNHPHRLSRPRFLRVAEICSLTHNLVLKTSQPVKRKKYVTRRVSGQALGSRVALRLCPRERERLPRCEIIDCRKTGRGPASGCVPVPYTAEPTTLASSAPVKIYAAAFTFWRELRHASRLPVIRADGIKSAVRMRIGAPPTSFYFRPMSRINSTVDITADVIVAGKCQRSENFEVSFGGDQRTNRVPSPPPPPTKLRLYMTDGSNPGRGRNMSRNIKKSMVKKVAAKIKLQTSKILEIGDCEKYFAFTQIDGEKKFGHPCAAVRVVLPRVTAGFAYLLLVENTTCSQIVGKADHASKPMILMRQASSGKIGTESLVPMPQVPACRCNVCFIISDEVARRKGRMALVTKMEPTPASRRNDVHAYWSCESLQLRQSALHTHATSMASDFKNIYSSVPFLIRPQLYGKIFDGSSANNNCSATVSAHVISTIGSFLSAANMTDAEPVSKVELGEPNACVLSVVPRSVLERTQRRRSGQMETETKKYNGTIFQTHRSPGGFPGLETTQPITGAGQCLHAAVSLAAQEELISCVQQDLTFGFLAQQDLTFGFLAQQDLTFKFALPFSR